MKSKSFVTLDRALSFHERLLKTVAKVGLEEQHYCKPGRLHTGCKRFHITNTSTGIILLYHRILCLGMVPKPSHEVCLVYSKLNSSVRTISRAIRSIPVSWLLVLGNITPPAIHREAAASRVAARINARLDLPIYADIFVHPPNV